MQIGGTKIGCIQIEVIEEPFCNNHDDPHIIKFTQTVSKHFGTQKTAGAATIAAASNVINDLCYDFLFK